LVDVQTFDLTLFLPAAVMENKTRQMYSYLTAGDWSDGKTSRDLAESIRKNELVSARHLINAFDPHTGKASPQVDKARELCRRAGPDVLAAGSGPAFFSLTPLSEIGQDLLRVLEEHGVRAIACRSFSRVESLGVREL
jgi:4-diphosphocytidyl-2C-methyl-D-erythritol kinase